MIEINTKYYENFKPYLNVLKKQNLKIILSILFICSFIINSFLIFTLDLYKIEANPMNLMGFVFTHLFGSLLLISQIRNKILVNKSLILCISLLILISLRIVIDTNLINFIKVCFYKYGIINYFILGCEFSFASIIIRENLIKEKINFFSNFIIIFSFIYSLYISIKFLAFDFNDFLLFGFYKETANNAYIIGLILISFKTFLIDSKNKLIKNLSILTVFNLSIVCFITGSTMIVIFFAFLLTNFIKNQPLCKLEFKKFYKSYIFFNLIYFSLFLILSFYINPENNDYSVENSFLIKNNSRLNMTYIDDFGNFFSPITSRLLILTTFFRQFSINPFVGDWQAEIISGYGEGYYIHSILLSSLTHLGIVGFGLVFTIIIRTFKNFKNLEISKMSQENFLFLNFLLVTILGTFFQFLTFMPFWFLMGIVNLRYKNRLND